MTTISSSTTGYSAYAAGSSALQGAGRQPPPKKPDFSTIDTDGSGGLNLSELQSMLENGPQGTTAASAASDVFSALDADGDGSITESELQDGAKAMLGEPSAQNGMSGMGLSTSAFAGMIGGPQGMQGPPPGPPPSGGGDLMSLDSDEDDSVSASEFGLSSDDTTTDTDNSLAKLFSAIDADGDGSLSSSEVGSFQEKMQSLFDGLASRMQAATASYQEVALADDGSIGYSSISFSA